MNRKDVGKEGRRQAMLEARRNGGKEEAIFGVFWGKKRKKGG